MADPYANLDDIAPIQPLISSAHPLSEASENLLSASRAMLAAASALSFALAPATARARELTAEAVEVGFLRALRRETLLGPDLDALGASALLRLPSTGGGIRGTGYGRLGASVTGGGARSQLYGTIGGAIGYAVGGPVGALLGGMLGGLLGGGGDDDQARREEMERRQWLNTPEGFEIEAYLYHFARGYFPFKTAAASQGWAQGGLFSSLALSAARRAPSPVVLVRMERGAVQVTGQSAEAGEQAARAFAGALGRTLRLNSVVVPAAGLGGDV